MITIIGVRFRNVGKVYYFSPRELDICVGDHVIVETARGVEYGFVVLGPKEVDDSKVIQPLKEVIRIATPKDDAREESNRKKEKEAFEICQKKIRAHNLAESASAADRFAAIRICPSLHRFRSRWQKSRTCP